MECRRFEITGFKWLCVVIAFVSTRSTLASFSLVYSTSDMYSGIASSSGLARLYREKLSGIKLCMEGRRREGGGERERLLN